MAKNKKVQIPLLATRGITVFPNMIIHFDVGRKNSIQAIEKAMIDNEKILLVSQKDATEQFEKADADREINKNTEFYDNVMREGVRIA